MEEIEHNVHDAWR